MSVTVVSRRVLALLALLVPLLVAPVLPAGSTPAQVVPTRAEREHIRLRAGEATVVRLDATAAHVAVYWEGFADARVQLAFSEDGERFGPWRDAGRDEDARRSSTTWGALHGVGRADAVRVRADRQVGAVTVLAISDAEPAVAEERQVAASVEAATTQPPVISRGGWGADEALMTWAPQFYETRKLIVHHTAGSSSFDDQAAAAAEVRAIYRYHAVDKGWGDIGYNFLIDPFGNVYEGRYSRDYTGANPSGDDAQGRGVTAAHASGWNSGTVGVAMLGTYSDADVTPAARQVLTRLLAWEAERQRHRPRRHVDLRQPGQRCVDHHRQHRRPPRLRQHGVPGNELLRHAAAAAPRCRRRDRRAHARARHLGADHARIAPGDRLPRPRRGQLGCWERRHRCDVVPAAAQAWHRLLCHDRLTERDAVRGHLGGATHQLHVPGACP